MSRTIAKQGNFIVLGSTGAGKTTCMLEILMKLKPEQQDNQSSKKDSGDEHHDNQ